MTEAELYRATIDLLRRDGWCKHVYTDHAGRHCISGAISIVARVDKITANHSHKLTRRLREILGVRSGDWLGPANNKEFDSIDDAIAALEIAADLATPSP